MIDEILSDIEQLRRVIDTSLKSHQKRQLEDEDGTPAGVLIPLFMKERTVHVLLTLRTNDVASHKGQISFPGGAWEDGDKTILDTALRETQEEVGIRPADVEVIGELDDVMAVSSHRVTPYVGFIPHPYPLVVNTHEIAEVIEIPLSFFANPANRRSAEREHRGRLAKVHYYDYGRYCVWGLTAHILKEFLDLCFPDR